MKNIILVIFVLTISNSSFASSCQSSSSEYGFWVGFKSVQISTNEFEARLSSSIVPTVEVFGPHSLTNYLVALTPEKKPLVIPDQVGLFAFENEGSLSLALSSPGGQAFAKSQSDLYDQTKSGFAAVVDFDTSLSSLVSGVAYNVIGGASDWCSGVRLIYIGVRKQSITPEDFKTNMASHLVNMKKAFTGRGLNAYLVMVTDDYEVAYMQWTDTKTLISTFQSPEGQVVVKETQAIMNDVLLSKTDNYKNNLTSGKFYSVIKGIN